MSYLFLYHVHQVQNVLFPREGEKLVFWAGQFSVSDSRAKILFIKWYILEFTSQWLIKTIKNGYPCIVEIGGTQGCALVVPWSEILHDPQASR